MKINSLLIVIVLFIISCIQAKDMKTSNVDISGNDTTTIDYSDYVHLKPKDSLSIEELEIFNKLEKIIYENMSVDNNNKFSFSIDRDSFINMGIPEKYYILLMKNIEDNNYFAEKNHINPKIFIQAAISYTCFLPLTVTCQKLFS